METDGEYDLVMPMGAQSRLRDVDMACMIEEPPLAGSRVSQQ
jgi:hypothetical protein